MPIHTIYTLIGILCGVSVLSFICSWSIANGFKFTSCKGDGSCEKEACSHNNKTAEKILALLDK